MYAKVFRSLWEGTLCGRPDEQLVFIYLLAHADSDGTVEIVPAIIAHQTGLPSERVTSAITRLMQADPESRTREHDGRRLMALDERSWGWSIPNYSKYRSIRNENDRREQNRQAKQRQRDKQASANVSHGQPRAAQAEVEAEGEAEAEKPSRPSGSLFDEFWAESPKKVGKKPAFAKWKRLVNGSETLAAEIIAGLRRLKPTWNPGYEPNPLTFLNQERWRDETNTTPTGYDPDGWDVPESEIRR